MTIRRPPTSTGKAVDGSTYTVGYIQLGDKKILLKLPVISIVILNGSLLLILLLLLFFLPS